MLVLLFKSLCLVVTAILVRSALPRYRIDQLLFLNWKFFIYLLIFFFVDLIFFIIFFN